MYKFFGEQLKEIKSKASGLTLFRFDTKGEFITSDEEIIKRALGFFDYIELKAEEVGERVKKTFIEPTIKITTKDEKEETKIYKCKKCEFETSNQAELMSHYRKEHPKGDGKK